jgi:hypothetical protein
MAANVWLKVDRFTHDGQSVVANHENGVKLKLPLKYFAAAIETTPASCVTDSQEA